MSINYEFLLIQDPQVAAQAFKELRDFMLMQGQQFLPEVQKHIDVWFRQKEKMYGMIHLEDGSEPKVMGLFSRTRKGSIWVHEIIPLIPVMEQPFRKMIIDCITKYCETDKCKLIISQKFKDIANADLINDLTLDEANNLFDEAEVKMKETGEDVAEVKLDKNNVELLK